jgi:hypothetical protein
MTKILYEALRFFARWLQQPTVIQVAHSVEVKQQSRSGRGWPLAQD